MSNTDSRSESTLLKQCVMVKTDSSFSHADRRAALQSLHTNHYVSFKKKKITNRENLDLHLKAVDSH